MARPTKKMYIAVLAAFVLICGVGGWFAANWRGLAAAYYLRRAADPKTSFADVTAALEKARHYDRARWVAFWEREMRRVNQRLAGQATAEAGGLRLIVEPERYAIEPGQSPRLRISVVNSTSSPRSLTGMRWSGGGLALLNFQDWRSGQLGARPTVWFGSRNDPVPADMDGELAPGAHWDSPVWEATPHEIGITVGMDHKGEIPLQEIKDGGFWRLKLALWPGSGEEPPVTQCEIILKRLPADGEAETVPSKNWPWGG